MPQQAASSEMPNGMGAMNNFFPIFSAILCLSFQTGIGIYWIIGAVVRCVQMVAINRSMMKVDMEQVIKKNLEKASKKTKNKKKDISVSRVNEQAHINSRRVVEEKANQKQKLSDMDVVTDYSNNEKANNSASLFSKVNMVKKYDETATKKKINKAKPINLRDPSEITDPEARKKAEREERYRNAGQGKSSNKGSRQKK